MRATLVAASVGLALLGAACGGDAGGEPPIVSPTSAFPSEATTPPSGPTGPSATGPSGTGPLATGPSGVLPSIPPVGDATFTSGHVGFQMTGDVQTDATLSNLVTGFSSAPPGGFALVVTAGGADATAIGLGGGTFIGTEPTAPTLTLSIAVQSEAGFLAFISNDGECSVTLDAADASRLEGSFRCSDLRSGSGESVDVSGSFDAAG